MADVASALVTGGAGLAGAIVGALASYFASKQARAESAEMERQAASRLRAEEAASLLLARLGDYREMEDALASSRTGDDEYRDFANRSWEAHEEIGYLLVRVPQPLQARLHEAFDVMRYADRMGHDAPYGYATSYLGHRTIRRRAYEDANACISAFLLGDDLPRRPAVMIELEAARESC